MRVRTAAPMALAAVVAIGSLAAPADAAKKKPISKTYDVTMAPLPDAQEATGCESAARADGRFMDVEEIKVAGAGVLTVKITKFQGDWDMAVYNSAGANVAEGAGTATPNTSTDQMTETLKYKSKKAQTLSLRVCNFLGTPTATVSYTYVYN